VKSKTFQSAAFSQQKCCISIPLTQSKSGTVPKFLRDLQPGSNPNLTKFATVRIQSQSSAHLCCTRLQRHYHAQIF